MTEQPNNLDISTLPDLDTMVGIPGPARGSEMGGQPCSDVGIAVILIAFSVSDQ